MLVATTAGAIDASAVQVQIGLGETEPVELVSPATVYGRGSGRAAILYGTDDLTSHTLQAFAFEALYDDTAFGANEFGARYCESGECFFEAPLLLPAGALIEAIELEACDTSFSASVVASLWRSGALESGMSFLVGFTTGYGDTPGCNRFYGELPVPETVDNAESSYLVQVHFVGGMSPDARFQAVRVFYRLQVSPPPGSATFNDVPTGHVFFPFIEALAASGITSGCGGGNFCPNAPLTRGQMAVFLAKALGLYWVP